MKKMKLENVIAFGMLAGMLCLFGSFLFDGSTKAVTILAAILALAGLAVVWLVQNRSGSLSFTVFWDNCLILL